MAVWDTLLKIPIKRELEAAFSGFNVFEASRERIDAGVYNLFNAPLNPFSIPGRVGEGLVSGKRYAPNLRRSTVEVSTSGLTLKGSGKPPPLAVGTAGDVALGATGVALGAAAGVITGTLSAATERLPSFNLAGTPEPFGPPVPPAKKPTLMESVRGRLPASLRDRVTALKDDIPPFATPEVPGYEFQAPNVPVIGGFGSSPAASAGLPLPGVPGSVSPQSVGVESPLDFGVSPTTGALVAGGLLAATGVGVATGVAVSRARKRKQKSKSRGGSRKGSRSRSGKPARSRGGSGSRSRNARRNKRGGAVKGRYKGHRVYIAKNGQPYIRLRNGKTRFVRK